MADEQQVQHKHPDTIEAKQLAKPAKSAKSIEQIMHPLAFKEILSQSVSKLSDEECYPDEISEQFERFDNFNE